MSLATWKSFGGVPEQARWVCASCESENQVRIFAETNQQIVFTRVCEMNNQLNLSITNTLSFFLFCFGITFSSRVTI